MFEIFAVAVALGLFVYLYKNYHVSEDKLETPTSVVKVRSTQEILDEIRQEKLMQQREEQIRLDKIKVASTYVPPVRNKPFANNTSQSSTYVTTLPTTKNDDTVSSNITSAAMGYVAGSIISSLTNRDSVNVSHRYSETPKEPEPSYSSYSDSSGSAGGGSTSSWDSSDDSSSSSSDSGSSWSD